jgi:DNA-binding MarR family transcriptional regulator
MTLAKEIKKRKPFQSLEQEAMLNVLRTADVLGGEIAGTLKLSELTPNQYNVLRILRGAGTGKDEGPACGEIAQRMITRDPDITRLLDRLEKRALITRCRPESDRRVVRAAITPSGLKLLAGLDPVIEKAHRNQLGHMSQKDLKTLIQLLERARKNHHDQDH